MRRITGNKLLRYAGAIGGLCLFLGGIEALRAQAGPPLAPAQFDPSDVYFQGYLSVRAAEEAESAGRFVEAAEKFSRAMEMFQSVRRFYPEWKPEMVTGRAEGTGEAFARVKAKAEQEKQARRNAVAELEGGTRKGAEWIDPSRNAAPLTPGILEVDPLQSRRLEEAQAEVARLRQALGQNSSRTESRLGDVSRSRDALQADLRAAENQVQALRSKLAAAPVQQEMQALNGRIGELEQEREAMALALQQSRQSHTEAIARISTLEADLKTMRQKASNLERDLKQEREIANSVVSGQRRQLDDLEKQLEAKDEELAKSNERIKDLLVELDESRAAFGELKEERDSLVRERDQMAALLKLNEGGRIQELIEQNMGMARQLREANERVEAMNRESNADKDAITDALRDLAIAKTQINRMRQEKLAQDQRLKELEQRLREEGEAIARGEGSADPAEAAVLRDIIQRQLRVQERRRQAKDLLVEAARKLGAKDEKLAQAIALFDGQELELSPEEAQLVEGGKVDGEFVSPFARDRATVGRATAELSRDLSVFERTAEKAFVAGRYLPTRELYQMILEQNPGHTPALCKLGVVHLKLEDPVAAVDSFRRAVELDDRNPYACRMLGFSLMALGDYQNAEPMVKRALEIAPSDPRGHMLLATICYRLGRSGEAESYFKSAIDADPLPSEPYFNLALLCARDNRLEDARRYYQSALERGALPDPALEQTLAEQP